MRTAAALIVGLTLSLALLGCKEEAPPAPPSAPPAPQVDTSAPVTADEVEADVEQAAETTGQYVSRKKDEVLASATKKLDELEVETADLRARLAQKSKELSAEAKVQWEEALEELEAQKEVAKVKLEELREKSGPVMERARQEFDDAAAKASSLFRRLKARVTGEPEPATEPATDGQPVSVEAEPQSN